MTQPVDLRQGDCMALLRGISDGSVDAVVTDPPYGMAFQSNRPEVAEKKAKIANDSRPFIWFLPDAFRVCREGGCIVCFTDWKNQEVWRSAIETAGFQVRSHCVWDRAVHGMGDLKASFGPSHDVFWFATKGSFAFPGTRPKSVLRHMRPASHHSVHPTRKPVPLMREIVESVCPVGGLVLDPFAGSGSTGEAAAQSGRRAILMEIHEPYLVEARQRLGLPPQEVPAPSDEAFAASLL